MPALTPQASLNLALDYLAFNPGRYIFPIAAGKKFPPCLKDNLASNAFNDDASIRECARKFPGCNWGLAHRKSNVLVVDVDTKPGKNGQVTYDLLDLDFGFPATEMTRSPTGGFHQIYDGPHIFAIGRYGFGDDIDSPNYSLIAGCVTKDGVYASEGNAPTAKAPQWFYTLLGRAKEKKASASNAVIDLDQETNVQWATLFCQQDAEPAIEGKGGDMQTVKTAMWLRDNGISEELGYILMLEFYNPRCQPEWDAEELRTKVANGYRYANQSAAGERTGQADFENEPFDPASIITEADERTISRERREREKGRQRLAATPLDQRQKIWNKQMIIDDWVFVADIDRFVNINDPRTPMWKRASFDAYFKYVAKGKLSENFFAAKENTIRRFEKIGYRPGQGVSVDGGRVCNLYRPSGVTPKEGEMDWWYEHVAYLFPDSEDQRHLMNWLAWFYQNIDKKPKHALLLQGRMQGTGKSFIVEMLARAIGKHNRRTVSQNDLHASFNGYAMNTKLIAVEELRAVERMTVKNALHDIITQDDISINQKNMPTFDMENCFGVIAMTNDDAAISIDMGDRRYLVLRTEATPRNGAYYGRLYGKLNDPEAIAAFAWMLQTYDYGQYNGADRAPYTSAKEEMIAAGLSELEAWMCENRDTYPLSGRVISTSDVIAILPARLERIGRLQAQVVSALKTHFQARMVGQPRVGNVRKRLYVVNGCPVFDMGGLEACVAVYEKDRLEKKAGPSSDFDFDEESKED
jgi:hypothetical protein